MAIGIVALSACGLNNGSLTQTGRSSSSGTSTPTSSDSTTSDDGAQGLCTYFTAGSLDRTYCIACYEDVLDLYCTGATSQDGCADPIIRASFDNYVNVCISNRVASGYTCSNTCSTGYTLNPVTCVCEADPLPPPVNPGVNAPTLTMSTDRALTGEYQASPSDVRCTANECCASQTLRLNAINQSDTSPTGNSYAVVETGCTVSGSGSSTTLPATIGTYHLGMLVSPPTLRPVSGLTSQIIWNLSTATGPTGVSGTVFSPDGAASPPACWTKISIKDSKDRINYYCYATVLYATDNGSNSCTLTAVPYSPSGYTSTGGWYQIPDDSTACIP